MVWGIDVTSHQARIMATELRRIASVQGRVTTPRCVTSAGFKADLRGRPEVAARIRQWARHQADRRQLRLGTAVHEREGLHVATVHVERVQVACLVGAFPIKGDESESADRRALEELERRLEAESEVAQRLLHRLADPTY